MENLMGGSPLARFASPQALLEGIREFHARFNGAGPVALALCGGVAMACYGSTRLTADLDFIVQSIPADLADGEPLSFGGVQTRTAAGVPVDLIRREDELEVLYTAALAAAAPRADLGGVPVVSAEFLVALKLAAGRPKDDWDLAFLLSREGIVDFPKARKIVHRYLGVYAARELDQRRATAALELGTSA